MILFFLVPLLDDQNFLFHPVTQTNLTLYIQIVNHKTSKVLVRNKSDWPLYILRQQKLDHIIEIRYDNCFLADAKSALQSATVSLKYSPFLSKNLPSCQTWLNIR